MAAHIMNRIYSVSAILTTMALAACVTINVYFPEAAAERAADRFIQDVLGEQAPASVRPQAAVSGDRFLPLALISPAHAQQPIAINIDTPRIESIKQRMTERHQVYLANWLAAGAIGLSLNGLVEIRDRSAIGLADRRLLERVVEEENVDRNAVYREIAVANGHPEWESDIRETFARRWIENARAGWYYQTAEGEWVQK
jgi:uncharacterized protein YdbL (DUF1318 family)